MNERTVLYADEGMVLTNGTDYGRTIFLADGADASEYYQITDAEYEAILSSEAAEEEDYWEALERFGVE